MTSKKLNNEKLAVKLKGVFAGENIAEKFKENTIDEIVLLKKFVEINYRDGVKKSELLDYMEKRVEEEIKKNDKKKNNTENAKKDDAGFDISNNLIIVDYDNIQPIPSEIIRLSTYNSVIVVCNCSNKLVNLENRIGRKVDTIKYVFVDTKYEQVVDMKIYKIINDTNDLFTNKIIVISKDNGFMAYRSVTGIKFFVTDSSEKIDTPKHLSVDNISNIASITVAQKISHIKGLKSFGCVKDIINSGDGIFDILNTFSLDSLTSYVADNKEEKSSKIKFLGKVINTISSAEKKVSEIEEKLKVVVDENKILTEKLIYSDKFLREKIEMYKIEADNKMEYIEELERKNNSMKSNIIKNSNEYNKVLAMRLGISEVEILNSIQNSISKSLEAKKKDELVDIVLALELDKNGVKSALANRISDFIMRKEEVVEEEVIAKDLDENMA